jgi:hypothetical protein
MIPKTIAEIEARIHQSQSLPDSRRAELLTLLATLKEEVGELAKTKGERAVSIAEHARAYADEATSEGSTPAARQPALERLTGSVSEFEETHPKLVEVVNRIATMLSNSGI